MGFDFSRLRRGEVIAGVSGAVLLVSLFALAWYGTSAPISPTAALLVATRSFNGWHAFGVLRWLILVTGLAALALACFQVSRRAPAIPACLSVIVTVLGLLSVLCLIYRVLINVPGPDSVIDREAGSYLGLVSAIGVFYGGYASMRQEGIAARDAPAEISTVSAQNLGGS
jgi:hypothetical protein